MVYGGKVDWAGTKALIEAASASSGDTALSEDTDETGAYDGTSWTWTAITPTNGLFYEVVTHLPDNTPGEVVALVPQSGTSSWTFSPYQDTLPELVIASGDSGVTWTVQSSSRSVPATPSVGQEFVFRRASTTTFADSAVLTWGSKNYPMGVYDTSGVLNTSLSKWGSQLGLTSVHGMFVADSEGALSVALNGVALASRLDWPGGPWVQTGSHSLVASSGNSASLTLADHTSATPIAPHALLEAGDLSLHLDASAERVTLAGYKTTLTIEGSSDGNPGALKTAYSGGDTELLVDGANQHAALAGTAMNYVEATSSGAGMNAGTAAGARSSVAVDDNSASVTVTDGAATPSASKLSMTASTLEATAPSRVVITSETGVSLATTTDGTEGAAGTQIFLGSDHIGITPGFNGNTAAGKGEITLNSAGVNINGGGDIEINGDISVADTPSFGMNGEIARLYAAKGLYLGNTVSSSPGSFGSLLKSQGPGKPPVWDAPYNSPLSTDVSGWDGSTALITGNYGASNLSGNILHISGCLYLANVTAEFSQQIPDNSTDVLDLFLPLSWASYFMNGYSAQLNYYWSPIIKLAPLYTYGTPITIGLNANTLVSVNGHNTLRLTFRSHWSYGGLLNNILAAHFPLVLR
jgi:hypothetical protein